MSDILEVSENLGFKLGRELSIEILNHPRPFISASESRIA